MQRWIIIFNLFVPPGFVQFLQYYYQSGCLYRLRALGERNQLDLTVGKLFLMNHFSCLSHLQHHVWVGEMGGERWEMGAVVNISVQGHRCPNTLEHQWHRSASSNISNVKLLSSEIRVRALQQNKTKHDCVTVFLSLQRDFNLGCGGDSHFFCLFYFLAM